MKHAFFSSLCAAALLTLLPTTAPAYEFFSENFESIPEAMPDADPTPLLNNGMIVGANVFNASNQYLYSYFAFPAPNISGPGARFSAVTTGQGGPDQGDKVVAIFNDYNNTAAHDAGDLVEAFVYVEAFLEEADLGTTVTFQFDAKAGNFDATPLVTGMSPPFTPEAEAFVKVLNPSTNYSTSIIDPLDATTFGTLWNTYFLTITIPDDPSWIGRLLQAGFRTKTSKYQASAIYYDNLFLTSDRVVTAPPPIKILSLTRNAAFDEFAITFEAEVGAQYELQKFNPVTLAWDYVFDITASSIEELLDDVDATEPTAIYRIIKL